MNTIANTVVNAITTFTKIVEVESQQAAQFDMPIKDFIREVMRASVAARPTVLLGRKKVYCVVC